MRTRLVAITLLCLSCCAHAAQQRVFFEGFEAPDAMKGWFGDPAEIVTDADGNHALHIANLDGARGVRRHHKIDPASIDGHDLVLRARVRARNVSDRPKSWNGIKVMLVLEDADGRKHYPQIVIPTGTFDATVYSRRLRISPGVRKASLTLGLEAVSGEIWVDNVEILTGRPERKGERQAQMFRGTDLPRLRGVMHGPNYREADTRVLGEEWGANHVRWQLNWRPMTKASQWAADLDRYDEWLEGALNECDKALDACERHGILVLVDLHCAPGGRNEDKVNRMFVEKRYQDKFIEVWHRIARRYKGRKVVWAYDLINEPKFYDRQTEGVLSWSQLALRATQAIREEDPGKPVLFEPGPMGACEGFDYIEPLPIDRVIYGFHMYRPYHFTHQGIHNNPTGIAYPGKVDGVIWNKERLRAAMKPALDFQRDYNVAIHVGEFSAARWAPDNSAYRWLRDVIDIFEEYGWDWTYHAYREYHGWSVEHNTDPKNTKPVETTDRKELLLQWFARNEKPEF